MGWVGFWTGKWTWQSWNDNLVAKVGVVGFIEQAGYTVSAFLLPWLKSESYFGRPEHVVALHAGAWLLVAIFGFWAGLSLRSVHDAGYVELYRRVFYALHVPVAISTVINAALLALVSMNELNPRHRAVSKELVSWLGVAETVVAAIAVVVVVMRGVSHNTSRSAPDSLPAVEAAKIARASAAEAGAINGVTRLRLSSSDLGRQRQPGALEAFFGMLTGSSGTHNNAGGLRQSPMFDDGRSHSTGPMDSSQADSSAAGGDNGRLREQVAYLEAREEDLVRELETVADLARTRDEELAALNDAAALQEQAIREHQARVRQTQTALAEAQAEKQRLRADLEALRVTIAEHERTRRDLEEQLAEERKNNKDMHQLLAELNGMGDTSVGLDTTLASDARPQGDDE